MRNIYIMGRDAIENEKEAFAYVLPAEQWDKGEARNLVEILQRGGLEAHQATSDFVIKDKRYGKGSVIFYGAQAFRPFLIDLMEKQEYPDQYLYPGGPPKPPYDLAGWTLPMQMGVQVDRIEEEFTAKTEFIEGLTPKTTGNISKGKAGYLFATNQNAAYKAVNLLLAKGMTVKRVTEKTANGKTDFAAGSFWVEGNDLNNQLGEVAAATGINFIGANKSPKAKMQIIQKFKLGIYKSWVANMDEGWTRWVMREHSFDLDTLQDADIRKGDLSKYAAIIIPSQRPQRIMYGHDVSRMPKEYTGGIGLEGTKFFADYVKNGGTLITFDQASDFAIDQFGLPIVNTTKNLSDKQFFIPGSLIRAKVDTNESLAYGMQKEIAASFSRSRAFKIYKPSYMGEGGKEDIERAPEPKANIIVQFAEKDLLMSGWANGEEKYLKNKAAMIDVEYGEGNVVLFSFRPQFRGQPRGTYKLIFNSIFEAASK